MEIQNTWFDLEDLSGLLNSTIGIERETLRVQADGSISPHPHSRDWGSRNHQPYILTDFAESQLELITPPTSETDQLLSWLKATHQIVATTNKERKDLMWPFSMPASIPEDRDAIQIAQLTDQKEYEYRDYLAGVYGKDVQLISGIHYNFQISPEVIGRRIHSSLQDKELDSTTYIEEKISLMNKFYLSFGRKYFRYRWLLTYLFGAAPYTDSSYHTEFYGTPYTMPMRSIRQSRYGYQNSKDVVIDYHTLEGMVNTIEDAVNKGLLSLEKELYRDIRFRGGSQVRDLLSNGISYMELRNIDINPYVPYGIDEGTVDFIRLFLLTLLYVPEVESEDDILLGNEMNMLIAESHPLEACQYHEEGHDFLNVMKEIADNIFAQTNRDYRDLISFAKELLNDPSKTLAAQILKDAPELDDFLPLGMDLAKQHQEVYLERPYNLHGFESLELSTQDVLKEAIRIGIQVEIIDASENLVKLSYKDHIEYVRNGNMTSADSLISYYLMENKVATKLLLAEVGIHVPSGVDFDNIDEASKYFNQLPLRSFVVKPKNTNYGLGISIFKEQPSKEQYVSALEIAFSEDTTVLIEEFIEGTELRFYVQNNDVIAVCERQPAHVRGDGVHTVSELIDRENKHPLRGLKHFAPMTDIDKGRSEELQLSNQGMTFDSVPENEQVVYLRENSNVSTGGLSIDRTEKVHSDFIDIAKRSAQQVQANFCGVDIIIQDYTQPVQSDADYGVIEANFNPAMSIHRFPGKGEPRLLGLAVLKQLFPEAPLEEE